MRRISEQKYPVKICFNIRLLTLNFITCLEANVLFCLVHWRCNEVCMFSHSKTFDVTIFFTLFGWLYRKLYFGTRDEEYFYLEIKTETVICIFRKLNQWTNPVNDIFCDSLYMYTSIPLIHLQKLLNINEENY